MKKEKSELGSNWKRKFGLSFVKKYELVDGEEKNKSYSIRFFNERNMRNIVDMAKEGEVFNINEVSEGDRMNNFISAGVDNVILSLNKSYELSASKKKGVLIARIEGLTTLIASIIFGAALNFTNTMNRLGIQLEGYTSATELKSLFIVMVASTLLMFAGILMENSSINKIEDYTHEAELFILEHKPEAMKDLLQKKHENTTGARIKKLFHRNKKKEEI